MPKANLRAASARCLHVVCTCYLRLSACCLHVFCMLSACCPHAVCIFGMHGHGAALFKLSTLPGSHFQSCGPSRWPVGEQCAHFAGGGAHAELLLCIPYSSRCAVWGITAGPLAHASCLVFGTPGSRFAEPVCLARRVDHTIFEALADVAGVEVLAIREACGLPKMCPVMPSYSAAAGSQHSITMRSSSCDERMRFPRGAIPTAVVPPTWEGGPLKQSAILDPLGLGSQSMECLDGEEKGLHFQSI